MADNEYYEDENGQLIPADSMNWDEYSLVSGDYPEVSTGDLLLRSAGNIVPHWAEQVSGLGGMAGVGLQKLGAETIGDWLIKGAETSKDYVDASKSWIRKQTGNAPTKPGTWASFLESSLPMASDLGVGLLIPAANLSKLGRIGAIAPKVAEALPSALVFGGQAAGNEYQALVDEVGPEVAAETALAAGGIGAVGAAVPVPFMKDPNLTRWGRAKVSALGNAAINSIQGTATRGAEQLIADRNYTIADYLGGAAYDAATGLPVGAAVGAGLHGPISRESARRINADIPDINVDSSQIDTSPVSTPPETRPEIGVRAMSADEFREVLRKEYAPKQNVPDNLPVDPGVSVDLASPGESLQFADQSNTPKDGKVIEKTFESGGKPTPEQVIDVTPDDVPVETIALVDEVANAPEMPTRELQWQDLVSPVDEIEIAKHRQKADYREGLDTQALEIAKRAHEFEPEFRNRVSATIADVPESIIHNAAPKSVEGIIRKTVTENEGKLDKIKDVNRATIEMSDIREWPIIYERFKQQFGAENVSQPKDKYEEMPEGSFRAVYFNAKAPAGHTVELQVTYPEMYWAKETGHGHNLYKISRNDLMPKWQRNAADAAAKALYKQAHDFFLARMPAKNDSRAMSENTSHESSGRESLTLRNSEVAKALAMKSSSDIGVDSNNAFMTLNGYPEDVSAQVSSGPSTIRTPNHDPASLGSTYPLTEQPSGNGGNLNPSIKSPPDTKIAQHAERNLLNNELPEATIEQWLPGKPGERVLINPTVRNLPPKSIAARPDLMQFREGANKEGVTAERKIREKYQNLRRKPVWVWEPRDPKKYGLNPEKGESFIIVDGHHGLSAAKESDVPSISSIILREADGIDAEMAMMLGAERNVIKAGRGNSTFREAFRFGQMAAKRWGVDVLNERAKSYSTLGQEAASVGANAIPDVYQGYLRNVISEAQASSIVKSAMDFAETPNDLAEMQKLGLAIVSYSPKEAKSNGQVYLNTNKYFPLVKSLYAEKQLVSKLKTVDGIRDVIEYIKDARIPSEGTSGGWDSVFDNNAGVKVDTAAIIAKREWRNTIIKALSGAKANERLVGKDLSFAGQRAGEVVDEAAKARFEREANETLYKLDNIRIFPDVRERLDSWKEFIKNGAKGDTPDVLLPGLDSASGKLRGDNSGGFGPLFDSINSEKGSTPIFTDAARLAKGKIRDMLSSGGTEVKSNAADEWLNRNPVLSPIRKKFSFFKTVAERFRNTAGGEGLGVAWDSALVGVESKSAVLTDSWEALSPFYSLPELSQAKIGNIVYAAQQKAISLHPSERINLSADVLKTKYNLTDAEIAGYQSVRGWLNGPALDYVRAGLMSKSQKVTQTDSGLGLRIDETQLAKIDEYVSLLRNNQNYAPLGRFGDRDIVIVDKQGKMVERYFAETKAQERQIIKDAKARGFSTEQILTQKLKQTEDAAYESLPANIQPPELSLGEDAGGLDPRGFSKHLVQAKHVPGASKDLGRSLAEYVVGLSNFVSANEMRANFKLAKAMTPSKTKGASGPLTFIQKFEDDLLNTSRSGGVWSKLNQAAAVYMLGYRASTALINMTQPITTTTPALAKYFKGVKPEVVALQSYSQSVDYLLKPKEFQVKHPEMFQQLESLKRNGWLDQNIKDELGIKANPSSGVMTKVASSAMGMQAVAEKMNRTHAAICAYRAAKEIQIPPQELSKFIRDFVNDTQFIQGKLGRPDIARTGLGSSAMMFKTWSGNWLRLLRNQSPADYAVWGRMIGYMLALGGAQAIPFVNWMSQGLESSGTNPRAEVRKYFTNKGWSDTSNKIADIAMYGVPNAFNINIGRAVGFGDMIDTQGEGSEIALKILLGPLAEFYFAPKRAMNSIAEKDYLRAVEGVMPASIRRVMGGIRAKDEGFRTPKGDPVLPNPSFKTGQLSKPLSDFERYLYMMGLTPTPLSMAYEYKNAENVISNKAKDLNSGAGRRIAKALEQRDTDATSQEVAELYERWLEMPANMRPPISQLLNGLTRATETALIRRQGIDPTFPKSAYPALMELKDVYSKY